MLLKVLVALALSAAVANGNQPPGVPPKGNVQQPPVHHQQQQQQFQQQQLNVQEGQGHGHGHGHGHDGAPNKLKFQSEIHNAEHIIEHLQNVIKTKSKEDMSQDELEFHYFKMHDYDNNNKLDGVEIGKALTHFHDDHEEEPEAEDQGKVKDKAQDEAAGGDEGQEAGSEVAKPAPSIRPRSEVVEREYTDDVIENMVDEFLAMFDADLDGYVDYVEFKKGKTDDKKA